jgi:hypothetical protein
MTMTGYTEESSDVYSPEKMDYVLAQEIHQLSVNEREQINEEIHGVLSLAVPETTEFIEQSLTAMENNIQTHVLAYRQLHTTVSCSVPLHRTEAAPIPAHPVAAYLRAQELGCRYMQERSFRILFLRAARYDTAQAAKRFLGFLGILQDVWGDHALVKGPWTSLTDFSSEAMAMLRSGVCQVLPGRDRAGRRIHGLFGDMSEYSFQTRVSHQNTARNSFSLHRFQITHSLNAYLRLLRDSFSGAGWAVHNHGGRRRRRHSKVRLSYYLLSRQPVHKDFF